MHAWRNTPASLRYWIFPGITGVSVGLWYLSDAVHSNDGHVHLLVGSLALLSIALAAIVNWVWKWLPRAPVFAAAIILGSLVVCVLAYTSITPMFAENVYAGSPTVRELILTTIRGLLIWSGVLTASIFLMAHESFQRPLIRTGLWAIILASSLLLMAAIFFEATT